MKIVSYIFIFLLTAATSYYYLTPKVLFEPEIIVEEKPDSVSTITLALVGDLMCHSVQFNYAYVKDDSFDFSGVFEEVKPVLSAADFTIGNFETVLGGKEKRYSGYPFFNAPDDFLYAIKDAGFDLLVTANNHALDQGSSGVERTIEKMDELGIIHTGTYLSRHDRDSIRIVDIKGIKLAVLAYSYSTNGVPVPKGKDFIINLIDYELIKKDITASRKNGAEIVLVFFHFGEEYEREPNIYQKDVVQKTIDAGADIIIGSHPHVVQPLDYFVTNNAKLDTGFIAYSLGNFVSNQRWRYSDAGVILNIQLTKNFTKDTLFLSEVNFIPTWVYKGKTTNGREYIIYPSTISIDDSLYNHLADYDKQKMLQAFDDTEYILMKYLSGNDTIKSVANLPSISKSNYITY